MKNLILVIFLMFIGSVFAQKFSNEDVVGVYKEKSNDPVGGSTFVFLPDQSFVMSYFGGLQKGTWEIIGQDIRITKTAEPQFALYGRNLNSLGNKTQVDFSMDADNGVMVGLDSNKKSHLKPVFNEGANCYRHPYIFTQNEKLVQLYAAQTIREDVDTNLEEKSYSQVYHFNIFGVYNDLILINLPSEYTEKWSALITFENDKLYLEYGDEGMQKSPIDSLSEEDITMINHFSKQSLFPNQIQSGDEFFPYSENPTQEELKPYNRIDVLEISQKVITIEEIPFFTATCGED